MSGKLFLIRVLGILLVAFPVGLKAQPKNITGPAGSVYFGANVTVLTNGNYVVTSPGYGEGGNYNFGAVYLYNGKTHELISTLKGSRSGDNIGDEIYALPNGNFVVVSHFWQSAPGTAVGAVTWASGTTGVSGPVSSANSIVGTNVNQLDQFKSITVLPNGNFVIAWPGWNNGSVPQAGAATWVDGNAGITGTVSSLNSLVGSVANGTISKSGITVLTNGNYVVGSPAWATWGNGSTDITGTVSTSNSLSSGGMVTALQNGNYVIASPNWDNGVLAKVGAVTWADGTTGLSGTVSAGNSIVGSTQNDQVGAGPVVALSNGNYVFASPYWDNGAIADAGALTWANGAAATVGLVSQANSLYGTHAGEQIGMYTLTALTNGNYVVSTPLWDHNGVQNVGAVTWGNGTTGTTGEISELNSLYGTVTDDRIGSNIVALTNGNYVVGSIGCTVNGIANSGAVTWGNGTTGTTGAISSANSLYGGTPGDQIGYTSGFGQIVPLANGNYVVSSLSWHGTPDAKGAVTWANGATGTSGVISSANSLVDISNYQSETVHIKVTPLTNGNYVVATQWWTDNDPVKQHFGAVVWGSGTGGVIGTINASNALLIPNKQAVYAEGIHLLALPDGNYVASNELYQAPGAGYWGGAATWGNGFTGTTGEVNACNSIIAEQQSFPYFNSTVHNPVYDYLIYSRSASNAITIFSPTSKPLGANSATGQTEVAGPAQTPLPIGDDCEIIAAVQANGADPVSGTVNAKVWVESTVPTFGSIPFVARHYEITPAGNAGTATGAVTLFFSQSDFDSFNASPGSDPKLPSGPADAAGISSIRIGKYPGTSSNGTGLPGSYTQGASVIDPNDSDVKWNADFQRWEVTFQVAGFSGFILQTDPNAFPVRLVSFMGRKSEENAELQWSIADAENFSHFEIERSSDAKKFETMGKIAFRNGQAQYLFTDVNAFAGKEQLYYRLKMQDIDGTYAYSRMLTIYGNAIRRSYAYPNPADDYLDIKLENYPDQPVTASISNLSGYVLETKTTQISGGKVSLDLTHIQMPAGIYLISIKTVTETMQYRMVRK